MYFIYYITMLLLHYSIMSMSFSYKYGTTSLSTTTTSGVKHLEQKRAFIPNSSTANAVQNQVPEFFVRNSFDDGTLHMQGWHELEGEQVLAQTRRAVRITVATFLQERSTRAVIYGRLGVV